MGWRDIFDQKGGEHMAKTGSPPRYKTKEEMQEKIDEYFTACEGHVLMGADGQPLYDKNGRPIITGQKPPTITGLALALGFTSRQALLNYQAKREFVDTITRAKSRVEAYAEERLFDRDGVQGAKFNLTNNFKGWSDRPQTDGAGNALAEFLRAIHPTPGDVAALYAQEQDDGENERI